MFVSYAKNSEDTILWNALKHVEQGRYVDVGARDPVVDSVSKAFYDQLWRGVHVEPVHQYAEALCQHRRGEVVLKMGVSDTYGTQAFSVMADAKNLDHTSSSERQLWNHKAQVPMLTLTAALDFLANKDIHWLRVAVEDASVKKILSGWDSQLFRPWVLLIKATSVNADEVSREAWHATVLNADYQFAYSDGWNHFYVANEHSELVSLFGSPPDHANQFVFSKLSQCCLSIVESYQFRNKQWQEEKSNLISENCLVKEDNDRLKLAMIALKYELNKTKMQRDELGNCSHHWWSVSEWLLKNKKNTPRKFELLLSITKKTLKKFPRLFRLLKWLRYSYLRLRFGEKNMVIDVENAKRFDDLLSVKIMEAVRKVCMEKQQASSIIFLGNNL